MALLPELIWVLNLTPPALAPLKSNTIRVICVFAISEFVELNTICLMCFCYSYYYYYYSKSIAALRRKGRRHKRLLFCNLYILSLIPENDPKRGLAYVSHQSCHTHPQRFARVLSLGVSNGNLHTRIGTAQNGGGRCSPRRGVQ